MEVTCHAPLHLPKSVTHPIPIFPCFSSDYRLTLAQNLPPGLALGGGARGHLLTSSHSVSHSSTPLCLHCQPHPATISCPYLLWVAYSSTVLPRPTSSVNPGLPRERGHAFPFLDLPKSGSPVLTLLLEPSVVVPCQPGGEQGGLVGASASVNLPAPEFRLRAWSGEAHL